MFSKIHSLEPDTVIEFYLAKKGVSKKHSKNIKRIKAALLNDTKIYKILAVSGEFHKVSGQISNVDLQSKKSLKILYDTYVTQVSEFISLAQMNSSRYSRPSCRRVKLSICMTCVKKLTTV